MIPNIGALRALGGHSASLMHRLRPMYGPQLSQMIQTARPKPQFNQSKSLFRSDAQTRPFNSTGPKDRQYYRFKGSRPSKFSRIVEALKPRHFVFIGLGASGVYLYNVEEVEMTGRRRFNCISNARELDMGTGTYREILASERGKILSVNHPLTKLVDEVMQDLIADIEIEGADWRVYVIQDDENQNAFVLPGVFVYTGILPICKDTNGLAAVLAHEIAHVVAHHPAERMSNGLFKFGIVMALSLLFDISGQFSSLLVNLMYSLPNSRVQEAEADKMGLMIMSKACFNPQAAVQLTTTGWRRLRDG
ncbi:unnamed protein product [Penicillium olsonii]|nr:unnamed protein product [Penicillium olsonii]